MHRARRSRDADDALHRRDGRTGNTKLGGYAKADRLDGDIRRFALGPSMTARQRLTVVGFEPEGASGR